MSNNTQNIKERVIDIVSRSLDIDLDNQTITEESEFIKDLGADSLHLVDLIMALEDKFDIEISDDQAEKLKTIGDVVKYLQENVENIDL